MADVNVRTVEPSSVVCHLGCSSSDDANVADLWYSGATKLTAIVPFRVVPDELTERSGAYFLPIQTVKQSDIEAITFVLSTACVTVGCSQRNFELGLSSLETLLGRTKSTEYLSKHESVLGLGKVEWCAYMSQFMAEAQWKSWKYKQKKTPMPVLC